MKVQLALAAFVALVMSTTATLSAEFVVEMLNKSKVTSEMNVYEPGLVRVKTGDTIKWTAPSVAHNVAFIAGAIPSGVPVFTSGMKKEVSFTFTTPGIYVYKCSPHFGMGMVGVVVVGGDKSNLAAVRAIALPPKVKARIAPHLTAIESGKAA